MYMNKQFTISIFEKPHLITSDAALYEVDELPNTYGGIIQIHDNTNTFYDRNGTYTDLTVFVIAAPDSSDEDAQHCITIRRAELSPYDYNLTDFDNADDNGSLEYFYNMEKILGDFMDALHFTRQYQEGELYLKRVLTLREFKDIFNEITDVLEDYFR